MHTRIHIHAYTYMHTHTRIHIQMIEHTHTTTHTTHTHTHTHMQERPEFADGVSPFFLEPAFLQKKKNVEMHTDYQSVCISIGVHAYRAPDGSCAQCSCAQ
jgi:hypothetical protein